MKSQSFRHALLSRELVLGTWLQLGHAGIAEILANVGYRWIGVDMEHTDIDVRAFTELARGMYGRGAIPLARVRENDTLAIRQVLDAGAQGVIVPLVNTAEEARHAVAAAKYPPRGVRGFCFGRMNNFGRDFDTYKGEGDDEVVVIVMIESRTAVEQIDEILSVDGVDGVFIGPYDMSGSYDVPGQTEHPQLLAAFRRVLDACAAAGKAAGIHVVRPTPERVAKVITDGFTFVCLGADCVFLQDSARAAFDIATQTAACT